MADSVSEGQVEPLVSTHGKDATIDENATTIEGWKPGDPCATCGSTATVWLWDGILMEGHCNGCGRSDWDDY